MSAQYAIEAVVVLAVLVTVAGVAAGLGDRLAPSWRDARPLVLPTGRRLGADDLAATRFSVAFRGYRMADVDLVLDRLAAELEERDAELDTLRAAVVEEPSGVAAGRFVDESVPPPPPPHPAHSGEG